ncbi:hypothetical protein MmiEs2_05760 [Methanimicrococcus stummii]|uniref:Uncharacterized protein n=1 Tax=Methanimicrococcus stummii TaxID=3028294 RepID=A0AA96V9K0_9EURY|nr:hypothetical protein [Methanimicrococcus sp. Es2]WNY28391.1 hypothetical protein MmiEs2_05760 [Methanimicrococcus sp. Es2]
MLRFFSFAVGYLPLSFAAATLPLPFAVATLLLPFAAATLPLPFAVATLPLPFAVATLLLPFAAVTLLFTLPFASASFNSRSLRERGAATLPLPTAVAARELPHFSKKLNQIRPKIFQKNEIKFGLKFFKKIKSNSIRIFQKIKQIPTLFFKIKSMPDSIFQCFFSQLSVKRNRESVRFVANFL